MAALGTALATLGVRPDEQVLILMPAELGFADAIVGTIRLGAVPLPMSPWTWTSELLMVATKAGSRLAVVSAERIRALANLRTLHEISVGGEQGHWATVLSLDLNPPGGTHRLRHGSIPAYGDDMTLDRQRPVDGRAADGRAAGGWKSQRSTLISVSEVGDGLLAI